MSMGVVNESEFDAELVKLGVAIPQNKVPPNNPPVPPGRALSIESETNSEITAEVIDSPKIGRGKGNNQVPDSLRALIGETAITEGRQSALGIAAAFGLSDSSVSAYTKGATSTASYNEPSEELKAHLDKKKLEIQKRASNKLFKALKNITDDKLENSKAKDLSAVAKDMSVIIRNMEPEIVVSQNQRNQFVLYAPIQLTEDRFETITVNE